MYRKIMTISFIMVFLIMVLPIQVSAQGIAVSPGIISIDSATLGHRVFVSGIKVINNSDQEHSYLIYSKMPDLLKEGYEKIPDSGWITVDINEASIPAQSSKTIEVWVRIPNNSVTAEKKYECWVASREQSSSIVALEAAVRVLITTASFNSELPVETIQTATTSTSTLPPSTSSQISVINSSKTVELTTTSQPIVNGTSEQKNNSEFPVIPVAIIASATFIIMTLIITLARRRKY